MPTYNSGAFVSRTLDAIVAQTYSEWELLITDDCSGDDTYHILQTYAARDPRIQVFQLSENAGAGAARNHSIARATGRYVAFCDSDDLWLPTKLEKQLAFMQLHQCQLCFTSYIQQDEAGQELRKIRADKRISYQHELIDDGIGMSTMIYDTKKQGVVYLPLMRKRQDWAYKLRLLKSIREALGVQECLVKYTLRRKSISRNKLSLVKYNIRVYREEIGMSYFKSVATFLFVFMPYYIYKKLIKQRMMQ